jgi:hypothetical protein
MTTAQPNLPKQVKWVWLEYLLIIVVAIIAGCRTAEKLLDKAERKDPAIVAKYARDKYPCTDLLKNDTAIIWKDSIIYIDCPDNTNPFEVVVIKTDTVKNTVIKTVRVPVTVPIQVKYITKWYEDSAKLKIYATELNKTIVAAQKLQADKDKLTAKAARRGKENWIWRIIATVLICWQVWKIYRKITTRI